ncbi:hypothetical protein [Acaryochloris marina]|uniref:Lipoprotein n=1 Tax=Acaryochloris marina (strain MBIC 11017) TaxID=329726 RepID=B0C6M1_ACAM1|nr:hypothetical protein [Acaryochloris marina]ABW26442.1 hypothetical protein AM1_1411 [Acaryochloris marina MBIC11017]
MRIKGTSFAAFSILGGMTALTISACSSTATWKDYSSAPGKYSVSMPGTPKEETKAIPAPGGEKLNMEIAQLDLGKEAFVVAFMEFPGESKPPIPIQQLMSTAIKGAVASSINGKVSNEKETEVNGVPCRDFQATGKYKSKDASMAGKFCFTGNRLYQVLAMGENTGKAFDDKATKFLASFKITDKS